MSGRREGGLAVPLYMDRHDGQANDPPTVEEVYDAHRLDLEVQAKYGVKYLTALVDVERNVAFCIVDAPSKELAEAVHREAHGNTANNIIEVDPEQLSQFLGAVKGIESGELHFEPSTRTILFTDIEGSTELFGRLGDDAASALLREHDEILHGAVALAGGRMVKHTGDGAMAAFSSVVRAVECAADIQRSIHGRARTEDWPIRVRCGLSAGEPVTMSDDLFGVSVNLAARICASCTPGAVLAPNSIRELTLGKGFRWEDRGEAVLRGFDEPVHLYELDWRAVPERLG